MITDPQSMTRENTSTQGSKALEQQCLILFSPNVSKTIKILIQDQGKVHFFLNLVNMMESPV
jgi:hypothetical protein